MINDLRTLAAVLWGLLGKRKESKAQPINNW
jgi:hypothetical protein